MIVRLFKKGHIMRKAKILEVDDIYWFCVETQLKLCLATWKVYGNLVKENQEIRPHMQKRLKIYRPNVNKNRIKRLLILECQPRQPMVTRIVTYSISDSSHFF